jgi:hypothetical protein
MFHATVLGISFNVVHLMGIVLAGAFFYIATMGLRR